MYMWVRLQDSFILFVTYVLMIAFHSESHRLTSSLSPKLLSLIPLAFERVREGCLVRLYPGIEEVSGPGVNGDWKTVEKVCIDLLLENNAMNIEELINGIEVDMGVVMKCRVCSHSHLIRC